MRVWAKRAAGVKSFFMTFESSERLLFILISTKNNTVFIKISKIVRPLNQVIGGDWLTPTTGLSADIVVVDQIFGVGGRKVACPAPKKKSPS